MSVVIAKLFFAAYVGLLIGFFFEGLHYLKEVAELEKVNQSKFNKQQFVKDNRDVFGINEKGCAQVNEVYAVSPQDMGF